MYTIDGWIVRNTVSPGGGTSWASAMPLSTSELMVLEICCGRERRRIVAGADDGDDSEHESEDRSRARRARA